MAENLVPRPPIITVLGHVDHGKTSLLDAIRHTSVTASESGGITQHIGAYQVEHEGKLITFIDTPGHAAFSAMRSRGGQIADIAILVVAANDGVMPQTKESLEHIRKANIPFIVALTKADLPDSDFQKVKSQLAENDVFVEGFGGNTPVVEVSARSGANLDKLLETLLLMAELEELTASPDGHLEAIIIESNLDRFKGPLCTLIVQNGTLKEGDSLLAITDIATPSTAIAGKGRSLSDWKGNNLKQALPATPVQLLGFDKAPPVGSIVTRPGTVDQITKSPLSIASTQALAAAEDSFKIILKTDVTGTLEAILGSLPPDIEVIASDTGAISESDVQMAQTTGSTIIAFRVNPSPAAKKLAEIDHVDIFAFTTIYDLLEALPEIIQTSKDRRSYELELAKIKVLKLFEVNGLKIIGAVVTSGSVGITDAIRLEKNNLPSSLSKVSSLRIGRETVTKVRKGEEFGLILDPEISVSPADMLVAFKIMVKEQ